MEKIKNIPPCVECGSDNSIHSDMNYSMFNIWYIKCVDCKYEVHTGGRSNATLLEKWVHGQDATKESIEIAFLKKENNYLNNLLNSIKSAITSTRKV